MPDPSKKKYTGQKKYIRCNKSAEKETHNREQFQLSRVVDISRVTARTVREESTAKICTYSLIESENLAH